MNDQLAELCSDPVLARWLSPELRSPGAVESLRQSALAKPHMRYLVLDNFFRPEPFGALVQAHRSLRFSEEVDRRSPTGAWLPYDGAVQFATPGSVGGDLFFCPAWHRWVAYVLDASLPAAVATDVKLRCHRPDADGFWIHTDGGGLRQTVAICYFNPVWLASDGGLLQLWRVADELLPGTPQFDFPTGRMNFLAEYKRLRTAAPGGGWADGFRGVRDLVLHDQVVPASNRMFLCNFQTDPCYHSVTPSNGKARYGFVQWIGV